MSYFVDREQREYNRYASSEYDRRVNEYNKNFAQAKLESLVQKEYGKIVNAYNKGESVYHSNIKDHYVYRRIIEMMREDEIIDDSSFDIVWNDKHIRNSIHYGPDS